MKADKIRFTRISKNRKTGYIPVTTSEEASCPSSCPLKEKNICYAKKGKARMTWLEVKTGINKRWNKPFNNDYDSFIKEINVSSYKGKIFSLIFFNRIESSSIFIVFIIIFSNLLNNDSIPY